ncbi:ABC transporter permease [Roseiterribacter gracilis]|uniref:Peptide ABC transporter permease n=1 Tax=Roseiterribacter gracilis TaxID=2812848 RepID=A0A8S8XB92_9PROT|nr:peptide ABC transporter permease [Rhodospirillales bacterium TMPK1]
MSALQRLRRRPLYLAAFGGLAMLFALAVLGAIYTPYDPLRIDVAARLVAPSRAHLLGTDQFGRDLLSRLMAGAAVSLRVSLFSVVLAMSLGITLGACAGYFGGLIDRLIGTLVEALLAMPGILLALVLVALLGSSETGVVVALGLAYTPNVARVVRGHVLTLRDALFVQASFLFGHGSGWILRRHILPNLLGPLTVLASSYFAQALLSESVLSFLGLGVPPPHPSWGGILAEGRSFMHDAPFLSLFPGLAIALTLLCTNLTGDALRDAYDPRMRVAS